MTADKTVSQRLETNIYTCINLKTQHWFCVSELCLVHKHDRTPEGKVGSGRAFRSQIYRSNNTNKRCRRSIISQAAKPFGRSTANNGRCASRSTQNELFELPKILDVTILFTSHNIPEVYKLAPIKE